MPRKDIRTKYLPSPFVTLFCCSDKMSEQLPIKFQEHAQVSTMGESGHVWFLRGEKEYKLWSPSTLSSEAMNEAKCF